MSHDVVARVPRHGPPPAALRELGAVVAIPEPGRVKVPLAYALPPGDTALAGFVDTWIRLKHHDGTIDELFQHWILGRPVRNRVPRWSVLRDVIGWGEPEEEPPAEEA
jgi:hypothetical protein